MHRHSQSPSIPPRWRVLAAGVFALLLSLGVARFAYTPLLPQMQAQAGLGVAAAGWLATVNYAGYLSGAFLASRISDLVLKDRLYRAGMVLAVLSTWMMTWSTDPLWWAFSRYLGGLSSSAGMLLASGLVLNWLMRHGHRSELGIQFAGIGLGIAGCAAFAAWLTSWLDWEGQWLGFSALAAVLLVPALAWLPRPDALSQGAHLSADLRDRPPGRAYLRLFMAAYFCAGAAYVIGATFIVDIVNKLPGTAGQGNWAFLAIGLGAAPASMAWDLVARRVGDLWALTAAGVLQLIGILLPVTPGGLVPTMVGAVLFGATFVGMVSLVLTIAGRYYPTRPAKMMGQMTLSYGAAQIIAPAVTASIAVRTGTYVGGLYLAAAAMVMGIVLLLFLMRLEPAKAT